MDASTTYNTKDSDFNDELVAAMVELNLKDQENRALKKCVQDMGMDKFNYEAKLVALQGQMQQVQADSSEYQAERDRLLSELVAAQGVVTTTGEQVGELQRRLDTVTAELEAAHGAIEQGATSSEQKLWLATSKLGQAEEEAKRLNAQFRMMSVGYGGMEEQLRGARWTNAVLLLLAFFVAVLVSTNVRAGNVFDVATWPVDEAREYVVTAVKGLVQ